MLSQMISTSRMRSATGSSRISVTEIGFMQVRVLRDSPPQSPARLLEILPTSNLSVAALSLRAGGDRVMTNLAFIF